MRCVRIDFTKIGESKYISHLDLMRCMSRAVRRARLPMWYTEGFNPHPYMSFALPLSLGMESECESMDIRIEGDMTNEQVFSALKAVMPAGIDIIRVREPVFDPKAIAFGRFVVTFTGEFQPGEFSALLVSLLEGGSLKSEKLSKQGRHKVMKEVDVSANIKQYKVNTAENAVLLEVVLPAGSTVNINPSLVADAVKKALPDIAFTASILRKELLTAQMEVFR
ncbi:MAG: TIGR03936 family radical SAM-associated protein [Clostridia bacterium]|nr:TIGR03936 family radical SAM-associated protein [Clostridia bacterium]